MLNERLLWSQASFDHNFSSPHNKHKYYAFLV
jgi:hypothetical protein